MTVMKPECLTVTTDCRPHDAQVQELRSQRQEELSDPGGGRTTDPDLPKVLRGPMDPDPLRIQGASGSTADPDPLRIQGASFSLKEVQAIAALTYTGHLVLSRKTRESLVGCLRQASGECLAPP